MLINFPETSFLEKLISIYYTMLLIRCLHQDLHNLLYKFKYRKFKLMLFLKK